VVGPIESNYTFRGSNTGVCFLSILHFLFIPSLHLANPPSFYTPLLLRMKSAIALLLASATAVTATANVQDGHQVLTIPHRGNVSFVTEMDLMYDVLDVNDNTVVIHTRQGDVIHPGLEHTVTVSNLKVLFSMQTPGTLFCSAPSIVPSCITSFSNPAYPPTSVHTCTQSPFSPT
jgi:hypothetical protein